jgi:leukotriene A-4 hydrolase/aminopeptidase
MFLRISLLLLFMVKGLNIHAQDFHSCARPAEARIRHLELDLNLHFDKKIASGSASYRIEKTKNATALWLDTRNLLIESVLLNEREPTTFQLESEHPFTGQPLRIEIKPNTETVTVNYSTTPESAAMQWLDPEQTLGKKHPFLFTQGQAILSRSWIPIQDSPGIRFTWNANIHAPEAYMVVMSGKNPTEKSDDGSYQFRMDLPVPAYLIALAAGNISFKALSDRTGVYAEPEMLERAAYELVDMEKMLQTASSLYGPYQWGRYDVIVLPPSFPFGGMENPRLTFATPTIISGDRSLTSLIAHELAHSWSGNLVTNSTWDDFWLNEGFTVYFERRIMEALYGKEYSDMLEVLGYQDLQNTLIELGSDSKDTHLKLDLKGRDPDDGMTDIAYEKGFFFLKSIEKKVGRERMDLFLKKYFINFGFKGCDTEQFEKYLLAFFGPEKEATLKAKEWIYQPGLPSDCPIPQSQRFHKVDELRSNWEAGKYPVRKLSNQNWSTHEWLHFLRKLSMQVSNSQLEELDEQLGLSESGNSELQFAWFEITIAHNYAQADKALSDFLLKVGRRKFVLPLYKSMLGSSRLQLQARTLYRQARPGYHFVTQQSVDELMGKK